MSEWRRYGLNLTEVFRSAVELGQLPQALKACLAQAPDGDGHCVLVLPGFTGDDKMTIPLRRALKGKGYNAHAWKGGVNLGLDEKTARHLRERLEEIFEENGGKKVTLIGHSLGGIYARELAREFPEMVRAVITVGSPFGAGIEKSAVPAALTACIQLLSGTDISLDDPDMADRILTPPPVPTTSIFSREDGIAGWQACLNPPEKHAENIEVRSSHIGLIWNVESFTVIFDRLAQPEKDWKPFHRPANDNPPKNPKWKHDKKSHRHFFKR